MAYLFRLCLCAGSVSSNDVSEVVGVLENLTTITINEYEQIERFLYAFCALFGLLAGILIISILARGFK